MLLCDDEKAAQFFFLNRNEKIDDLRKTHTKIHPEANINSFHLAREIVRQKFKYIVKFVKGQDLIHLSKEMKNEVLYVMLQPAEAIVTHVVCIHQNRIIDGTFHNQLKYNSECLRWLCSDSEYTFHGYTLQMSPRIERE